MTMPALKRVLLRVAKELEAKLDTIIKELDGAQGTAERYRWLLSAGSVKGRGGDAPERNLQ